MKKKWLKAAGKISSCCVILMGFLMLSLQAMAASAWKPLVPTVPELLADPGRVLGDVGGVRPLLSSWGVDLKLVYLSETLSNVAGGRRSGTTYAHQITMTADLDLEKILSVRGLSFRMLGVQRAGRDVMKNYTGDVTLVEPQQVFGVGGNVIYHLVQLYLQQKLDNNRLTLTAGFYPPNMNFGSFPLGCYTLNNVICSHPIGVSVSSHWRSWPYADLGLDVDYKIFRNGYFRVGLFQDTKKDGGIAGFTITTASLGVIVPMEMGWNPVWTRNRLMGHYKVGGYVDTSDNKDLYTSVTGRPIVLSHAAARIERQRGAWYVGGDQMLYRMGPGPRDGLIFVGVLSFANGTSLPYRRQYSLGLVAQHFIAGRPFDYISLFFSDLQVNPNLTRTQRLQYSMGLPLSNGVKSIETKTRVLELSYSAHVFRGVSVSPDMQVIFRPDGGNYYKTAVICGFQLLADL